jgi:hypothetical protein
MLFLLVVFGTCRGRFWEFWELVGKLQDIMRIFEEFDGNTKIQKHQTISKSTFEPS